MENSLSDKAIRQIGVIDNRERSFDASIGRMGMFWRSEQTVLEPTSYEAQTPAGLHIGCGIANIATKSADLGSFSFDGAGLTAMFSPEGTQPFQTVVRGRFARAAGLFLSEKDLLDSQYSELHEIVAKLQQGAALRATFDAPLSIVNRLCAPADPWFQGAARDLAFEARAIEISALVLSWLAGHSIPADRSQRHKRYALAAREVLERRLADPPTINELAREVGINARTLTDAFRACFGTSIAFYVTAARLDWASALLEQGASPSEVARQVGYTASHLSNAFYRRFGVHPEAIRRASRFPIAQDKG